MQGSTSVPSRPAELVRPQHGIIAEFYSDEVSNPADDVQEQWYVADKKVVAGFLDLYSNSP